MTENELMVQLFFSRYMIFVSINGEEKVSVQSCRSIPQLAKTRNNTSGSGKNSLNKHFYLILQLHSPKMAPKTSNINHKYK